MGSATDEFLAPASKFIAGAPKAPRRSDNVYLAKGNLVAAAIDVQENGVTAPAGAVGVITHVYAGGSFYEVRFVELRRMSLCVERSKLELIFAKFAAQVLR